MSKISVQLKNVTKSFEIKRKNSKGRYVKTQKNVLKDVSFEINDGTVLGLVGRNGSGKSTLLKILSGIMLPDSGTVLVNGKVASILELGMGFHPDLSGYENIFIKSSMYGFSDKETKSFVDDIILFSELDNQIYDPVRTYSSGMYARLAFAIAIHVKCDIVIIDEILSVGDVGFNLKCRFAFEKLKKEGKTIIIASHSLDAISEMCDDAIWIEEGIIQEHSLPQVVCSQFNRSLTQSPEILISLANSGDNIAQNRLGVMYRDGIFVDADLDKSIDWFKKAINSGSIEAMINMGDLLVKCGNIDEALPLFEKASLTGNHDALNRYIQLKKMSVENSLDLCEIEKECKIHDSELTKWVYADSLFRGIFSAPDWEKANLYYVELANAGNVKSMLQLGYNYRDGYGVPVDIDMSVYWFKKASDYGSVPAMMELAIMYKNGIGVDLDVMEAISWYSLAADYGDTEAMYQLGVIYRDGLGVEKDLKKSDEWLTAYSKHFCLEKKFEIGLNLFNSGNLNIDEAYRWIYSAASGGLADAQWYLGYMYMHGVGVPCDYEAAYDWLTKASNKNKSEAMVELANIYLAGFGKPVDFKKAFTFLEKASKIGNVQACHMLAIMYRDGMGTNQNLEEAKKLFKKASDLGMIDSRRCLYELKN